MIFLSPAIIWGWLLAVIGVLMVLPGVIFQVRRARPGIEPLLLLGIVMIVVAVVLVITAPPSTTI